MQRRGPTRCYFLTRHESLSRCCSPNRAAATGPSRPGAANLAPRSRGLRSVVAFGALYPALEAARAPRSVPGALVMRTLVVPRLFTGEAMVAPGYVVIDEGRVLELGEGVRRPGVRDEETIVLRSGILAPGLVDLQVNGGFGVDLMTAGPTEVLDLARRLPRCGVTSFCPTVISAPLERIADRLAVLSSARSSIAPLSARLLPTHLEGPFLSPKRAGAHDLSALQLPSAERVSCLLGIVGRAGGVGILTLAPELEGALDAIGRFRAAGLVVSCGHSDATGLEMRAAAAAGAEMVTHLFNASSPLGHREPGVAGEALVDPRFMLGLIVDFFHVCETVCRLVVHAAGDRIVLVSDATAALGMPPGHYELGGPIVVAREGEPPRREDGTLAGSALPLVGAVANLVTAGARIEEAIRAATSLPAELIGRPELGRIAPRGPADLIWLDDELALQATLVGGELAFGGFG